MLIGYVRLRSLPQLGYVPQEERRASHHGKGDKDYCVGSVSYSGRGVGTDPIAHRRPLRQKRDQAARLGQETRNFVTFQKVLTFHRFPILEVTGTHAHLKEAGSSV